MRELYTRAQEVMSDGAPTQLRSERVVQAKQHLAEALEKLSETWSEAEITGHLNLGNPGYWLGVDLDSQIRHANLIHKTEKTNDRFAIEFGTNEIRDATEVIVYSPDHPGLFSAIAGAMALCGASIIDAKVQTLTNGMALDSFWIHDNECTAYRNSMDLRRIRERVQDAMEGKIRPSIELEKAQKSALPNRTRVFKVPPHVLIDNKASRSHTVIEINGRNRPALLYDVTTAITFNGLQIASAHISTYGERVVDVFYVKDVFGLKIESERKIEVIRKTLMEAIGGVAVKPKKGKATAKPKKVTKRAEPVKP